jgi:hypothetical protein
MKRLTSIFLASLLLCSCQEKIDWWMTEAATLTMDRLVGEYALESVSWSGGAVDLDGDGTVMQDFASELAAANPDYRSRYSRVAVDMDENVSYEVRIRWDCCMVEDIEYDRIGSLRHARWLTFPAGGTVEIGRDGSYTVCPVVSSENYDDDSRICYLRNRKLSFPETGRLMFKAETAFYDCISGLIQRGTITYSFKCISGKGEGEGGR